MDSNLTPWDFACDVINMEDTKGQAEAGAILLP